MSAGLAKVTGKLFDNSQAVKSNSMNGGMGPYGRPAEKGCPPEPPLWHGHAWQPVGVSYMQGQGQFSDGYKPGPGDKPAF